MIVSAAVNVIELNPTDTDLLSLRESFPLLLQPEEESFRRVWSVNPAVASTQQ